MNLNMCVCSICSLVSYLLDPTTLMSPRQPIYHLLFLLYSLDLCVSIYSIYCVPPWRTSTCVFVSGEQMDSVPSPPLSYILLAGVWHECAAGHGNQRGVMSSPPDLPLVWVASICLIYGLQQLGDPLPKDTWRKRGGGGGELLQLWLLQALGGQVSLLWPLLQPQPAVLLWDNRRCELGVWWAVMFPPCVYMCASVCLECVRVIWLIGWSH